MLANNFLVLVEKSETLKLNKDSKKYKQYKTKARLELSNRIFNTYDKSVNVKYDIDINYTEEDTPLGTGGSLSLIKQRSYIKSNLIVVNGDVLNDVNMRSLLSDFYQSGAIAAICAKNYSMTVPYGVCEVDDMELTDLIEKPSYNFLINAGIYCLRKNALSFLEENKKIDMPDFLLHLKQIGEQVICIETDSNWLDVGRPNDFELASSIIMDLK